MIPRDDIDGAVCAIVVAGPRREETVAAVRDQTRSVAETLVVAEEGSATPTVGARLVAFGPDGGVAAAMHAGVAAGMVTGATWLWVLDGRTVPTPTTLEQLLAPLRPAEDLPMPALMASKVVRRDGSLDPESAPWPRFTERDITVDAARHGLMSIRAAGHGSLLVHRSAVEAAGLPRPHYVSDGDDVEWTARLLKSQSGFLAPRSIAVREYLHAPGDAPGRVHREIRNRLESLRGNQTWVGEEKLWVGFLLARTMSRELRSRPRPATARLLARAVRDSLRRPSG